MARGWRGKRISPRRMLLATCGSSVSIAEDVGAVANQPCRFDRSTLGSRWPEAVDVHPLLLPDVPVPFCPAPAVPSHSALDNRSGFGDAQLCVGLMDHARSGTVQLLSERLRFGGKTVF